MSKPSFRVHIAHSEQAVVGVLLRRFDLLFEDPPPSAYGHNEESVLAQLELAVIKIESNDANDLARYLWTETFAVRRVDINIHPDSSLGRRRVIGAQQIPLRLTFCYCELEGGGFRCALPRFDSWFVLESLSIAGDVIEKGVASALLGSAPAMIFDFRYRGDETTIEWSPDFLARRSSSTRAREIDEAPSVLAAIGEELVAKAGRRRLAKPAGVDPLFERMAELFEWSPPPSVLLVGPSCVGKTTFVHRLAHYLLDRQRGKRGEGRRDIKLWSTSADSIVAGMIYLGMWQDRVLDIISALSSEGDYLRVDKLTPLCAQQSDGTSIAELLLPAVASGEISLICEASEPELLAARQRNSSFVDQFEIVRLSEPPTAELVRVLEVYVGRLERKIELGPGAIARSLSHLAAFRRDLAFPGKAFQFFDWVSREETRKRLDRVDVSTAFAKFTGLPVEIISDDHPAGTSEIAERLGRHVIGQTHARTRSAKVIARLKAGLDDPQRPVATLFFVGPTGVGKTELARQIAGYLFGSPERLIRLDMSEYMLAGSTAQLLWSGDGVRSLAEQVRRQPLSVVLLDEIEKAHPDVFDLLLGVLGEGRLTDSNGSLVDFRMTVIIMTSNLGASRTTTAGFGDGGGTDYLGAVRRHFRPEFFGRVDHVDEFEPLTPKDVRAIVELELSKVSDRTGLRRRSIVLTASDEAKAYLAEVGFDSQLGARPLKRLIEDEVVAPLAVDLAAKPLTTATSVRLELDGGALEVRWS